MNKMNKCKLTELLSKVQRGECSCRAGADKILEVMKPKSNLELIMDNKAKAPKGNFACKINSLNW